MTKNEKELIIIPYAKEKQKKNKTINSIGVTNGISYQKISVFSGGNCLNTNENILNIIRDDDKQIKKGKKSHKLFGYKKPASTRVDVNLQKDNYFDDYYLRQMLGNMENNKEFINN